jgi:hypothetical protein
MDSDQNKKKVISKQILLTIRRNIALQLKKCNKANLQNPIKLHTENYYIID